ncbi:hypothetical protein TNCV_4198851 [Trichonephila clavipes]|nr:hypothetical protein TNCV_4198851 [Trichonephila clavipes]
MFRKQMALFQQRCYTNVFPIVQEELSPDIHFPDVYVRKVKGAFESAPEYFVSCYEERRISRETVASSLNYVLIPINAPVSNDTCGVPACKFQNVLPIRSGPKPFIITRELSEQTQTSLKTKSITVRPELEFTTYIAPKVYPNK